MSDLRSDSILGETSLTDDRVEQMLVLAERLRKENGGELDENAIQAVAEATGAPTEYVRLALRLKAEKESKSILANARAQYLALEPNTRRFVATGFFAVFTGVFWVLAVASKAIGLFGAISNTVATRAAEKADGPILNEVSTPANLLSSLALVAISFGIYNLCLAKDARHAATAGAILGGGTFASHSLFAFVLKLPDALQLASPLFIVFTILGAVAGLGLNQVTTRYRKQLGLKDPSTERQDLLRQLVELREKLQSNEASYTFLSVDIVGSTRMKASADPLAVEFTFNEYHQYVERLVHRYGGRVHSTAGDGMTCAFDHPQQAFSAARNVQAGLIELNTFRNKLSSPIQIRQAIHAGKVITPEEGDIRSVNFAHVIDVASHLQKTAPPGGIVVSDDAAMYLAGGPKAIGDQRVESNGVQATLFLPAVVAVDPGANSPPPLPG